MRRRLAVAALAWAAVLVLWALPAGAQTTTTDTAPASTTTTTTPCTTPPTDASGWALCAIQHDTENQRAELLTAACILTFVAGVVVVLKVWHP